MCLAVPGKIISIDQESDPELRRGNVDFGGVQKEVCLAFTPQAVPGDYVIVHVGFALSVVDEAEAGRILDDLRQLGELSNDETS